MSIIEGKKSGMGRGKARRREARNGLVPLCPLRPSCPLLNPPTSVSPSPSPHPPSNALLISSALIWIPLSTRPPWPALVPPMNTALAQAMETEIRGPAAIVSLQTLRTKPAPWIALLALVHLTQCPQVPPAMPLPTTETHLLPWLQRAIHRRQGVIRIFLPV